ncbi:hypothetical protein GGR54DRAFT_634964 [Hypoxylon sp. NC1633]|nr:hypothetical protein GGR54DRAFT_634964 [Hypoxylon sp. NC1633]
MSPSILATQAPSLLHSSIPEATVDPTILEVDDSDEDETMRSTRNSSTGTLEVIKTRFIRRLSQKSESRRLSQQSLGTSDEEIARRAELKRLMRKRIEEELKSEEEQEEPDEKSDSASESKVDIPANVEMLGGGPRDNIEFAVAGANEAASGHAYDESPDDMLLAIPTSDSQPRISLRRSSFPGSGLRSHENSISEDHGTFKDRDSLNQFPSSPQLAPVHLPSIRGSESLSSWRLSYSAEQLASYLGVPDDPKPCSSSENLETSAEKEDAEEAEDNHESCTKNSLSRNSTAKLESADNAQQPLKSTHDQQFDQGDEKVPESSRTDKSHDTSSDQDSPLDMWLWSQELHSNSVVSSRRTSDMILHMAPDSSNIDGRLSQSVNVTKPQEMHDKVPEVSDAWSGSQGSPPASRFLSCRSHVGAGIDSIGFSGSIGANRHRQPVRGSSDFPNDMIPNSPGHARDVSSSHYASSRYTPRPSSCLPAAKESRLSLIELFGGRRTITPFSGFNRLISPSRATDAEKSDSSSYKTAPNNASTLDITVCEVQHLRHPTTEANSVIISDTASFKQREAELKSIEKRFGQAHLRRDTATPIVSKFREEFNEQRTSIISKHSLLARLHLPKAKRAKHAAKNTRIIHLLDVKRSKAPGPESGDGRMAKHELGEDDAAIRSDTVEGVGGVRQRIIKIEEGVRDAQQHQRESSKGQECLENRQFTQESDASTSRQEPAGLEQAKSSDSAACVPLSPGGKPRAEFGPTLKPPNRHMDNNSQQSDISNSVLREWVNLMNDEDYQSQAELKLEHQVRGLRRFRTPPASWAKWPSHTRQERTGPAGQDDHVIPRDFAVLVEAGGSGVAWSTDKPGESSKRYVAPAPQGLSSQLGKAVRSSLSKVVQGTLNHDSTASSDTSRDHQKPDGHLEYPELEILPMQGGYKELQALEQQIGTMKRGSVTAESQMARLSADKTRTPMSMRLAEEVHMIQHKVSRDSYKGDEDTTPTLPTGSPMTTKKSFLTPPRVSEAADHLEMSEANVSYEDCVPKHMLEDERPTGDDAMATKDGGGVQDA